MSEVDKTPTQPSSNQLDYVTAMRRWASDTSDKGPSRVLLNGCADYIQRLLSGLERIATGKARDGGVADPQAFALELLSGKPTSAATDHDAEIERLTRDLAERDKVARDRLIEIERLQRMNERDRELYFDSARDNQRLRAAVRRAGNEALGCSPAATSEFKQEALNSIAAICAAADQGLSVETSDQRVANLLKALEAKQAKIDALMLEFCPGELPEGLRDPIKVMERVRAMPSESPLAAAIRVARGDAGPPDEPVRFAQETTNNYAIWEHAQNCQYRLTAELNFKNRSACTCGIVKAPEDGWQCVTCGHENPPRILRCQNPKCTALKSSMTPGAVIQCIWRGGCKHTEVCGQALRCVPGGIEGQS